jgi:hypothetical protein
VARILAATAAQPWVGFLTLTSRLDRSWEDVMTGWKGLVRWLRARGAAAHFACIKEEGEVNGMRHLHVIAYPWVWVDQTEISAEWERLTGDPIVWISRVSDKGRTARYVSKYVSKAAPPYRKTVTYSQGFPKLPKGPSMTFLGSSPWPAATVYVSHGAWLEHAAGCGCHGETEMAPWLWVERAAPWINVGLGGGIASVT